ncbi:MAG: hypothetical protein NVSMB48_27000 [Marmoricola sp.]
MATRFQINGEIFKAEELEGIKLSDTFVFDEQVYNYRRDTEPDFPDLRWADVQQAMEDVQGLSAEEASKHRRANLLTAATLWLTMRAAGKPMSFGDVCELDMGKDITWLPDTDDRAVAANPTKPRKSKASEAAANDPKPSAA